MIKRGLAALILLMIAQGCSLPFLAGDEPLQRREIDLTVTFDHIPVDADFIPHGDDPYSKVRFAKKLFAQENYKGARKYFREVAEDFRSNDRRMERAARIAAAKCDLRLLDRAAFLGSISDLRSLLSRHELISPSADIVDLLAVEHYLLGKPKEDLPRNITQATNALLSDLYRVQQEQSN